MNRTRSLYAQATLDHHPVTRGCLWYHFSQVLIELALEDDDGRASHADDIKLATARISSKLTKGDMGKYFPAATPTLLGFFCVCVLLVL